LPKEEWIDRFSSWTFSVDTESEGENVSEMPCIIRNMTKEVTIQTVKLFSQALTMATSKQQRTLFLREFWRCNVVNLKLKEAQVLVLYRTYELYW
jgi:hypothetical protein